MSTVGQITTSHVFEARASVYLDKEEPGRDIVIPGDRWTYRTMPDQTMVPESIGAVWEWEVTNYFLRSVRISGRMRLKSGSIGVKHLATSYSASRVEDLPEWAAQIVTEMRREVEKVTP